MASVWMAACIELAAWGRHAGTHPLAGKQPDSLAIWPIHILAQLKLLLLLLLTFSIQLACAQLATL